MEQRTLAEETPEAESLNDTSRRCHRTHGSVPRESIGSRGRTVQSFLGEIRLGSFDKGTKGLGHYGLSITVGIENDSEWRGFVVRADGTLLPSSHFNLIDGSLFLKPDHELQVRQALKRVGLPH